MERKIHSQKITSKFSNLSNFTMKLIRKYSFQFTSSLSVASLNPFFSGWVAIWIINEKFCTSKLHAKSVHWYLSSAKFDSGMLMNSSWDRQCNDFLNHCCCYLIPMCFISAHNKNLWKVAFIWILLYLYTNISIIKFRNKSKFHKFVFK